jgi:hypothetical protein
MYINQMILSSLSFRDEGPRDSQEAVLASAQPSSGFLGLPPLLEQWPVRELAPQPSYFLPTLESSAPAPGGGWILFPQW